MPTANINLQPFMFSPMANGVNMAMQVPAQIQDLQKNNYTNQILGATAQYAPQSAAADLALKLGEIPYIPYKYMSPFMGNYARLLGAGTNAQNSAVRFVQTPGGAQIVAANPQIMAGIKSGAINQANILNQGVTSGIMPGTAFSGGVPQPSGSLLDTINQEYQQMGGKGNLIPNISQSAVPASPQAAQVMPSAPSNANVTPSVTPDVNAAVNANSLKGLKEGTDSQARQRNLFATNIEKTLSMIDPNALTKYSGVSGELDKAGEFAKGLAGLTQDPDYINYQKSKAAADMLTNQVNQFYGGSVQPAAQQALNNILSPGSPGMSQAAKLAIFNQNVKILKNEMGTYRQGLQGTGVYTGNDSSSPGVNPGFSQQDVASLKQALPLPAGDQQKIANQFSQNDLEYTAKKYGMTVDQVKQKLGVQ
jgi:hypothetical protein